MGITTALHFSGGKDSLAILHMHRAELDNILVAWVNTGASYPFVLNMMAEIQTAVPHFLEIKSDQGEQISRNGYPSDLVPLYFTPTGRALREPDSDHRIQDTFFCCSENIWRPMHDAMKNLGITRIIRGQRNSEKYKAVIRSGHVEDGIEYVFPLEDWSAEQVFDYLKANNVPIPPYYDSEMHSQDCWNCTGYLDEAQARIANLPMAQRTEMLNRLRLIKAAITAQAEPMETILAQLEASHGNV